MEPSKEIVRVCSTFAGGFLNEGTESIVTVGTESNTALYVQTVVPNVHSIKHKDAVVDVSNATGIPLKEIEIKVYVMCGGAFGKDL